MSEVTQLYRHYDIDGKLLYIGISHSAFERLKNHRSTAEWTGAISRIAIENYPSRMEAIEAEKIAIISEKPIYNIHHNVCHKRTEKRAKNKNVELDLLQMELHDAMRTRDQEIIAMRKDGKTYQSIADAVGLTRARVHQIVRRGKEM